jgi:hypothetical protein
VDTIRRISFQMSLSQRFNDVTCGDIVHISSLEVNHKYPVEKAEKIKTRYGETILLSIKDSSVQRLNKVFLPKCYALTFKDDDITAINEGLTVWNLVYKGQCPNTNSYLLAIE